MDTLTYFLFANFTIFFMILFLLVICTTMIIVRLKNKKEVKVY